MAGTRAINKLSEAAIRSARPGLRLAKLSDGGGLQLWINPNGSKLWRLAYRYGGKQKLLALGDYPATGLADARHGRDEARRMLARGQDPMEARRIARLEAANEKVTFRELANEYVAKMEREGRAAATLAKVRWVLDLADRDIGSLPVKEIRPAQVLKALQRVERRGKYETARRMRSTIGAVFRYGVATARADGDPAQPLQGALTTPRVRHRAAIVTPVEFGVLLRAIDAFSGQMATRAALKLMAYLFPRPGELRQAEWAEFDLECALWTIPAKRTKMRRDQRKPLSRQAVAVLSELHSLTGFGPLAFPSLRSTRRPMSENTLNVALRRLGYGKNEATSHGFRATASTLLNESNRWSRDTIERELGHVEANSVRRAYARGEHMQERRKMIQWWADYCDALRNGGDIVAFPATRGER